MSAITFQITGVSIVYTTVCSGTNQRKHQSSASLAFVRGIHRWPVNSPHKGPVTWKMFPFDDLIMGDLVGVFFCSYCHIKIFKGNESGALTLQPPLVIAFSPYQKLHVSTPLKMAEKIYCDWASQYSCLTQFPIGSFVRWYFKDGLINTNKVKSVPVNSQKVKSHG